MQKVLLGQGHLIFVEVVDWAHQFERLDEGHLDMDVEGPSKRPWTESQTIKFVGSSTLQSQ